MAVALNPANVKEQLEKRLKAILLDCEGLKISVGIPGDLTNDTEGQGYINKKGKLSKRIVKSGRSVAIAEYASQNEFGVIGDKSKGVNAIPSRPAFRTTFRKGSPYYNKLKKIATKVLADMAMDNRDAQEYLTRLGLSAAGFIKLNIRDGQWKPNAPYTIRKKGSSKPLIDTGTMSRAITAWVGKR